MKVWGIRIGLVALFMFGFISHDPVMGGWNLFTDLFFPAPAPFVAPLSAQEKLIADDMKKPESIAQCRDYSVQRVKMNEAIEKNREAAAAFSEAMQAEMRISSSSQAISAVLNTANMTAGMDIRSAAKTFKTGKSSTF